MFYVDMHSHSVASDDGRATVDQYLQWIVAQQRKGFQIDGIVLTEHRQFNSEADYGALSKEYGIVVLKGSELDTRFGHFLIYGLSDALTRSLNFKDVSMDAHTLIHEARRYGAIAIPAHPGRHGIGLANFVDQGHQFPDVRIVESLNAGNRPEEQERANQFVEQQKFLGIGGSDAHFVSGIAKCMTGFPRPIADEQDLVGALLEGNFKAIRLENTRGKPSKEE